MAGHGLLTVSTKALEDAIYLPKGYRIVSVHYEVGMQLLQCLVVSDELETVEEYQPIPKVSLIHTVEFAPDPGGDVNPEFRKITGKVEKSKPFTGI